MNKIAALILLILFPFSSAASAAEQVFFYHTDPVGTPLAMTNASGQVVWRADYKPFGEENTVTANPKNNKEFVGKEKDEETGLYYFGARYLDSGAGRFVAIEPIRAVDPYSSENIEDILLNPQALNLYAYSMNNPYRYVDTDGKYAMLIFQGLMIATATLMTVYAIKATSDTKKFFAHHKNSPPNSTDQTNSSGKKGNKGNSPKSDGRTNPFEGPVDSPIIVIDPNGNAIPVGKDEQITRSPDGKYLQVKDPQGNETGTRIDNGHKPASHPDHRAQKPHAHRPGITNPDRTPWLPLK